MSVKKIIFLLLISNVLQARYRSMPTHCIMINPAGDTKNPGRTIDNAFERTIAMDFTESLQQSMDTLLATCSIIVTHAPGDIVYPLQNATFANRLEINLFISIHFFQTTDKNSIALFQYSNGDTYVPVPTPLMFIPFDKAYLKNYDTTSRIGKSVLQELKNQQKFTSFVLPGLYRFPCAPLMGIQAPALTIEIGITDKNQWQTLVEPMARAIKAAIEIL